MSSFVVQQLTGNTTFPSEYGKEIDPQTGQKVMYKVGMAGLLDGQVTPNAYMNVMSLRNVPVAGSSVEVSVEKQDAYGVKLKKTPAVPGMAPQPSPIPSSTTPGQITNLNITGGHGGAGTPPFPAQQLPDARQNSIERQSSLAQAVAYCVAKAQLYSAAKKHEEAIAYLEGKKVLQVATYLNKYVKGDVTVAMSPEEVAHEMGYRSSVEDVAMAPLPPEPEGEEEDGL